MLDHLVRTHDVERLVRERKALVEVAGARNHATRRGVTHSLRVDVESVDQYRAGIRTELNAVCSVVTAEVDQVLSAIGCEQLVQVLAVLHGCTREGTARPSPRCAGQSRGAGALAHGLSH